MRIEQWRAIPAILTSGQPEEEEKEVVLGSRRRRVSSCIVIFLATAWGHLTTKK